MAKKKKDKRIYSDDKEEALKQAIDGIHSEFGEGTLILGKPDIECEVFSTGALTLDLAIGAGGVPRGRITEIYGPEYSGKTTLALSVAASAQKQGATVAFIDAEHALDSAWAGKIGVNMAKMMFSQPDYGEQALQIVQRLAESGAVDLIIVDSVSALVPKAEIEGEVGDHHVGAQARMMSQALRMLNGIIHKTNTAVIFINQLRMKIGVMFGNPETTSGGRALRFYSSLRLDVRKIGVLKDGNIPFANKTRVKVAKNKVGRPFRTAEFEIDYEEGINGNGCLVDIALENKVMRKSGGNHYWKEARLGPSRNATLQYLKENQDIFAGIEAEVYEKIYAVEDEDNDGFNQEEN